MSRHTAISGVRKLARQAWLWAVLYVTLIPAMGYIYTTFGSGAFFDSNLTREAGFMHDRAHLERTLSQEIDRTVLKHHAMWSEGGAQFHFRFLPEVTDIIQPADAKPSLVVRVASSFSGKHFAAGGPQWFVIQLEGSFQFENGVEAYTFGVEPTGPYGVGPSSEVEIEGQVPTDVLFPPQHNGYAPILVVTSPVADAMQALYRSYAGNPSQTSGLFPRMLYFSATTATTLGLGDIQPVSSEARNAVTIEAIAGILFAGLFLNAIARRRRLAPSET
jgi:hypothetical protein